MTWQAMGWPGRLGRARHRRQHEFDAHFGRGNWRLAHVLEQRVLEGAEATRLVELSYLELFRRQPKWLDELCGQAEDVYENARSNARSAYDYSLQERKCQHVFDIALRRVVRELGRVFAGKGLVRIGGPSCRDSQLSPGQVSFIQPEHIAEPRAVGWWHVDSVLCFWESNRILLVRTA